MNGQSPFPIELRMNGAEDNDPAAVQAQRFGGLPEGRADHLRDLKARYNESVPLAVGDIVVWKKGMRNKRLPLYDEPAIVLEVLAEPIIPTSEPLMGTPLFREPIDIRLGILLEDGEYASYHFDAARFRKFIPSL
jgi:hypothetical protein